MRDLLGEYADCVYGPRTALAYDAETSSFSLAGHEIVVEECTESSCVVSWRDEKGVMRVWADPTTIEIAFPSHEDDAPLTFVRVEQ